MSEQEEIKILAQICLDEKWYPLKEEFAHSVEWSADCAFCKDASKKFEDDKDEHFDNNFCEYCLIQKFPICNRIGVWAGRCDKAVIITALKELVETGDLSDITRHNLEA